MFNGQPNEITLIFHSGKEGDEKTRAYVETIEEEGFEVKTIDLNDGGLTESEVAELVEKLNVDVDELFDLNYIGRLNNDAASSLKDLDTQDALRLLASDPMLMATPILIIGEHAYQFESS
jgi:arsenate reductase-like glutaredoxin family protein